MASAHCNSGIDRDGGCYWRDDFLLTVAIISNSIQPSVGAHSRARMLRPQGRPPTKHLSSGAQCDEECIKKSTMMYGI